MEFISILYMMAFLLGHHELLTYPAGYIESEISAKFLISSSCLEALNSCGDERSVGGLRWKVGEGKTEGGLFYSVYCWDGIECPYQSISGAVRD